MPPKKKVKAAQVAQAAALEDSPDGMVNQGYLEEVQKMIETITSHDMFSDIKEAAPLRIGKGQGGGGVQVAFNHEEFTTAMATSGVYSCGGNVFWMGLAYNSMPGVPAFMTHVTKLHRHYFSTACRLRKTIIIRVPHTDFIPMECKGSLSSPSPEEYVHTFLMGMSEAVKSGAPTEELKAWRAAALTASFSFELMDTNEKFFWTSVNLREDLVTDYAEMSRTGLQKVMEIVTFKRNMKSTLGNLSAAKVAELYAANAKMSESSEAMSDSLVDQCLTVHNRVLKRADIYANIVQCETLWGVDSPWHKVGKMHAVLTRARSTENIQWVFESIYDALKRGFLKCEACSKRGLVGEKGKRGIVDLFLAKKDMKAYMLTHFLDKAASKNYRKGEGSSQRHTRIKKIPMARQTD